MVTEQLQSCVPHQADAQQGRVFEWSVGVKASTGPQQKAGL
jgi:hypothetical protein